MVAESSKLSPPLESGDRVPRYEFERRYAAMPDPCQAELIEGVVYMASPVRFQSHGRPHAAIMAWLSAYWVATPGVDLSDNTTVRLDWENEPQPDALLRLESGGNSVISNDDYIEGAPELIVEVAASSAAYDLHDKKRAYQRNGVPEYIVWQMQDNHLYWFVLQQGRYVELEPNAEGIIQSRVFPGLCLNQPAFCAGNWKQVLATLETGLKSQNHAEFVQSLSANKAE